MMLDRAVDEISEPQGALDTTRLELLTGKR